MTTPVTAYTPISAGPASEMPRPAPRNSPTPMAPPTAIILTCRFFSPWASPSSVSDVALSGGVLDVLDICVLGFSVPIGLPSGVRARRKEGASPMTWIEGGDGAVRRESGGDEQFGLVGERQAVRVGHRLGHEVAAERAQSLGQCWVRRRRAGHAVRG